MKTNTFIIAVLFLALRSGIAQEQTDSAIQLFPKEVIDFGQSIPTVQILPEDVIQGSIHQLRLGTNSIVVKFTYTEPGAKKMLAFWEAHVGQTVRTEAGNYETTGESLRFEPTPSCATYSDWRKGWLKHRTEGFMVSADDAKKLVAALKSQ